MNDLNFKYLLLIFLMSLCYTSCSEDVDFNQINDLELSPVLESSLVFFDEPASQFVDNGAEIIQIQDFILINFFNNDFTQDNLIRSDFVFEYENSIHRAFQLQVDLIDNTDQVQYSFYLTADASPSNNILAYNYTEVFEDDKLDILKRTTKLMFSLTMFPGEPIDNNALGKIKLESKAVFYFNISDPL